MSSTASAQRPASAKDGPVQPADVLVIFGITGDLAKVMTFSSLYRLEGAGCWTARSSASRSTTGRSTISATTPASRSRDCGETVDDAVFDRFAARLSYVTGDFGDADTYQRVAEGDRRRPSPGLLPGDPAVPVRDRDQGTGRGRADEDAPAWSSRSRSATTSPRRGRWPTRSTSTSTSPSSTGSTTSSGRWAWSRSSTCGSRTRCSSRSGTATTSPRVQITMAESFGVEDRGHFYDPVGALRDVVVNHLMQVVAAAAMEPPAGERPEDAEGRACSRLSARCADADPAHYVRGQYEGYRDDRRRRDDSTTETYAALRLEIDNWRWSGVPFFIRTGQDLPVTADRAAARLQAPAAAGLRIRGIAHLPEPDQLVVRLDPTTGIQVHRRRPARATRRRPEQIHLDMEFAEEGGEGPTPYEVLLHAAMVGDSTRFTRQDGVEETWRVMQPLLDAPPPVHAYAKGSWGPAAADDARRRPRRLARALGAVVSAQKAQKKKRSNRPDGAKAPAAAPRTASRRAPPRRRRSRRSPTTRSSPTATPARLWRPMGRSTGSASRASTRRACSAPCSTARPGPSGSGPFGINVPSARIYEPGTNIARHDLEDPERAGPPSAMR